MNDKIKNITLIIVVGLFVFGAFLCNIFIKDTEVSYSERRRLAQISSVSFNNLKNDFNKIINNEKFTVVNKWEETKKAFTKDITSPFEKYSLDQFILRDTFRKIKAFTTYNIFRQSDNNDIYIAEGHASKYMENYDANSVKAVAPKFKKLYDKFLSNMNVYYSIIPDKNYFIAEKNGYPSINYDEFVKTITDNMDENIKYIDIFDCLTIDDYYKTDIHWRQEKLGKVVDKLAEEMDFETYNNYTENSLKGFYGVYYGQSALPLSSETLKYYTADFFDDIKVSILNEKTMQYEEKELYDLEGYNGIDPYDIYMHGAVPAIKIENPNAASDKELVIFRDSFGSSLTPLLIHGYKKITVLDLRYIATPLMTEDIVEFNDNQDVLIINCIDVLNNSPILKVL